MATHGTTCGFVGPYSGAGVVESTNLVWSGVKHTVVVSGYMPKGCEGTPIDESICFDSRNPPLIVGKDTHLNS